MLHMVNWRSSLRVFPRKDVPAPEIIPRGGKIICIPGGNKQVYICVFYDTDLLLEGALLSAADEILLYYN